MNSKKEIELKKGCSYEEQEILEMGVKSLNNRGMDYILFEKQSKIYFFEKEGSKYRLFDVVNRKSFYLSEN